MPTRDAKNSLVFGNMEGDFFDRRGITILEQDGTLKECVYDIMDAIKEKRRISPKPFSHLFPCNKRLPPEKLFIVRKYFSLHLCRALFYLSSFIASLFIRVVSYPSLYLFLAMRSAPNAPIIPGYIGTYSPPFSEISSAFQHCVIIESLPRTTNAFLPKVLIGYFDHFKKCVLITL